MTNDAQARVAPGDGSRGCAAVRGTSAGGGDGGQPPGRPPAARRVLQATRARILRYAGSDAELGALAEALQDELPDYATR